MVMENVFRSVPCAVKFKYPDGKTRTGYVTKATEERHHKAGVGAKDDYATRVELIEFEGEKKEKYVRFAYMRRSKGKDGKYRWNWASQTTWGFSVNRTEEAIEDARSAGLFD
jgi:hypothetical protein